MKRAHSMRSSHIYITLHDRRMNLWLSLGMERVPSFFYGVSIKSSFITFMFWCSCILYFLLAIRFIRQLQFLPHSCIYVHLSGCRVYCTSYAGGVNVCLCHLRLIAHRWVFPALPIFGKELKGQTCARFYIIFLICVRDSNIGSFINFITCNISEIN